jgi:hypothetical protein
MIRHLAAQRTVAGGAFRSIAADPRWPTVSPGAIERAARSKSDEERQPQQYCG